MTNDAKQPDRLHVFADASLTAYAKSRAALLNPLTLPKPELMGALTAARLCNFVSQALHTFNISIHLWSDSQIVLHWITGKTTTNVFVSHRITEIHLSGPDCWRYCPTQDNPADLLTRGITSLQLKMSTLWKHGQHHLHLSQRSTLVNVNLLPSLE